MINFILRLLTGVVLLLVFGSTFIYLSVNYFSVLLGLVLLEILIFEWPRLARNNIWLWLFSLIYLFLPIYCLILLNNQSYRSLLGLLLLIVPASDVGGYIFGKLFGKHKMCPKISPNKTWEGLVGSYLGVLFVFIGYKGSFVRFSFNILTLFFALLSTILATSGDLFESWLKRGAGLKDAGKLLPGHGGFLDRIDSFVFISVIFYLFKDFLVAHFIAY